MTYPEQEISASAGAQLAQINQELGRQTTKLEVIITKLDYVTDQSKDHEGRIRILEQFKNKLLGAAIVAGVTSGVAADLITYFATHH